MEDGRFEVAIIEQMPSTALVTEAAAHRLFGRDTEHVERFGAERLTISTQDRTAIDFTLDGEPNSAEQLTVTMRQQTLSVRVGPTYDPLAESN